MSSNTAKLDLYIADTHNAKTIGVGDISFYPTGFPIVSPTIQITPPAFKTVVLPYTAKNMTFFNSNTLNLTNVTTDDDLATLPDGIWTFKYTITPADTYSVEKTFLRTYVIEEKFGRAFLKTDLQTCDAGLQRSQKDTLDEVWYYIQGAIADANNCNTLAAMNKYGIADKILNQFLKSS